MRLHHVYICLIYLVHSYKSRGSKGMGVALDIYEDSSTCATNIY